MESEWGASRLGLNINLSLIYFINLSVNLFIHLYCFKLQFESISP